MERVFVWGGGALFVGSLALAAFTYGVSFGGPQPLHVWGPLGIDALLLTVFAAHHSAFAREPFKRALARVIPERLLRSFYVWVASLLLIALCLLWQPIGGDLYNAKGWSRFAFAVVQLAGVWLIVRSVQAIDALELAGIRIAKERGESLQSHGVYGLVRHPLYLGWVLVVFGSAHMTGDRLAFAVMTTIYLAIGVTWEERSLEEHFGPEYRSYRQQVRWRMIPFLY